MKATTLSCSTIRLAMASAAAGSPPSSPKISLTGCPASPPRALTSALHALSAVMIGCTARPMTPLPVPKVPNTIGARAAGVPALAAGAAPVPGVAEAAPAAGRPPPAPAALPVPAETFSDERAAAAAGAVPGDGFPPPAAPPGPAPPGATASAACAGPEAPAPAGTVTPAPAAGRSAAENERDPPLAASPSRPTREPAGRRRRRQGDDRGHGHPPPPTHRFSFRPP